MPNSSATKATISCPLYLEENLMQRSFLRDSQNIWETNKRSQGIPLLQRKCPFVNTCIWEFPVLVPIPLGEILGTSRNPKLFSRNYSAEAESPDLQFL